ncbi:hypothetical protein PGB90_003501 [Kerria lacca]
MVYLRKGNIRLAAQESNGCGLIKVIHRTTVQFSNGVTDGHVKLKWRIRGSIKSD